MKMVDKCHKIILAFFTWFQVRGVDSKQCQTSISYLPETMSLNEASISRANFQMLELEIFSPNLINYFFGQWDAYFSCHSLAHDYSWWVIHFHQILTPVALLISNGSRSPKPPTYLGLHNVFKSTRFHFLWPSVPHLPHYWTLSSLTWYIQ